MSHLVIGAGEVGKSLAYVLSQQYVTHIRDIVETSIGDSRIEVLHLCFPYSSGFVGSALEYITRYSPRIVIVHSTTPVGTTRKLGPLAVHSPVEGLHPNLAGSMLTFRKHFGGPLAVEAARIFENLGVATKVYTLSEITEAQKIMSTSAYGISLMVAKEFDQFCRDKGLDYKAVVLDYGETYNEGYESMGFGRFRRPLLFPPQGKIGGHCVVQNAHLVAEPKYPLLDMLAKANGEALNV